MKETEKRNELWKARHSAYWAILATKPGLKAFITDVCVPISNLTDTIVEVNDVIEKNGFMANIVGHVGDGNFHSVLMYDAENMSEEDRLKKVTAEIGSLAMKYDGTVTGEHGVGLGKKELLKREVGPDTFGLMQNIKNTLDPNWIMNPFKVFDPPSSLS